jgi:hypothetical protein
MIHYIQQQKQFSVNNLKITVKLIKLDSVPYKTHVTATIALCYTILYEYNKNNFMHHLSSVC